MISNTHKCIFIHIHKTGGTSIEKKLGHFDTLEREVQDHRTYAELELLTNRNWFLRKSAYAVKIGKRKAAATYLKRAFRPELTKRQLTAYYTFSFVRNSWGRTYSWYKNVMKDPEHRKAYKISDENYPFHSFLKEKINPETFSQLHFLKNRKGEISLDFIGRFENLQADFNQVGEAIGLEDTQLPQLLISGNQHYTTFYTQREIDLVAQLFAEEIKWFGFQYGE